jgi:hypothetical protein
VQEKVQGLERDSARWHEATRLRAYVRAVELMVADEEITQVYGEEPGAFLAWARAQEDRIDPLADSPASILDEKDKWSRGGYW